MCALFNWRCIALPVVLNLAHSSEAGELPLFQLKHLDFIEGFECIGKDNKCSEILLDENVFVACMERQH